MASRTDGNQASVVAGLRKAGARVQTLHEVGCGCPDILVGFRGINYLFEIKRPQGSRLTDREVKWLEEWPGQASVITTLDEALRIMGAV